MSTPNLILAVAIITVILLVGGITIWLIVRKERSKKLREKFGSEYDYTMEKTEDQHSAEAILNEREKHVSKLEIHDLTEEQRNRYHDEWTEIQANFVDDPSKSVTEANRLISEAMIARGFPVNDFEQRAADISVLYPDFVTNYRNANAAALKNQSDGASTEELRQAMVYYRSLFEELLGTDGPKDVVVNEKKVGIQ